MTGNFGLAHFLKHQVERVLRALQRRGVGDVEREALRLELAPGRARFGDALVGEVDIAPAGEQVVQVPFALAVAHEHEKTVGHSVLTLCHFVMPGLVPGIHVFRSRLSPDVDGRDKPGHDAGECQNSFNPSTSAIE